MVKHVIDNDQTSTLSITSAGESWIVNKGVSIDVVEHPGVFMSSSSDNSIFTVNGKISVTDPGQDNGDFAALTSYGTDTFISVGKSGTLAGETGINLFGNGEELKNAGNITGSRYGVHAISDDLTITNNGTIANSLTGSGIEIFGDGNEIVNGKKGVISGLYGIHVAAEDGDKTVIINDGTIESGFFAPTAIKADDDSKSVEIVRNHGQIGGSVMLGGGKDLFDGRTGSVDGLVDGGDDNDTYLVGAKSDYTISEQGGHGYDTIEAFTSVHIEDIDIEAVELQGGQDLKAFASSAGSYLRGNVGDNRLVGSIGEDTLGGGTGNDILKGGEGADTFFFVTGWDKDVITDFHSGEDTLYIAGWSEIESFKDLKQHHLSEHNGNLIIQSGDDRLVLQGMDKSDLHHSDVDFSGFF